MVVAFAVGIMSDYHLRFVDFVLVYLFCFYAFVRNIFDLRHGFHIFVAHRYKRNRQLIFFHTAMLFGESHVITFDNQVYTLHGLGDFILLNTNGLSLQGRLEESPQGNSKCC